MGKGASTGWWWLVAALLAAACAWPGDAAAAQALRLARLAADAPAAEVLAGRHDAALQPQPGQTVYERQRAHATWWRVTAAAPVDAAGEPQLVLAGPFLHRVQAWVPGARGSSTHALYGPDADLRYATRALVIPLPRGLAAGEAVWLRIHAPAAVPMELAVASRDAVHQADLRYVAWRSIILATLAVLTLLALAFWAGIGERSYGFFAGNLFFAALYIASMGGEGRDLPWVADWLSASATPQRLFGLLGLIFSNAFQRIYLDLPRRLPWLDHALVANTVVLGGAALVAPFFDHPVIAQIGNVGLLCSAGVVLVASAVLSWRGDRSARILLLSWLPLIVFSTLRTVEMMGWWGSGPDWLAHALAGSFALAGLLLTFGLADKLLELRRDRDRASERASLDELTGALSRAAIEQRLRDAVAAAQADGTPLSIAFVDIDQFKRINDTHGHQVGDGCLRYIARRVRNRLRHLDAVGRYGGDELLVLMPDTALGEALQQAEQMRAAVACRPLVLDDGLLLDGTLSVGVAELRPGEPTERLLQRADAALYASKAAGRNCVRAGVHATALDEVPA